MQNWSHLRTTTFTATTTTDHEEYITHKKLNEWAMGEHVFWKSVWWFLQKVKHNTVIRPNNSTPKQEKQSTQRTCKYSEQHYSSTPPPPKNKKRQNAANKSILCTQWNESCSKDRAPDTRYATEKLQKIPWVKKSQVQKKARFHAHEAHTKGKRIPRQKVD